MAGLVVVLAAGLAGCGSSAEPRAAARTPSGVHTMADGSVMSDDDMTPGRDGTPAGMAGTSSADGDPSAAARMICSDEIAGAVRRNLALASAPHGVPSWNGTVYSCSYGVAGGAVRLSVRDATGAAEGRAWYDDLRRRTPGARAIRGMQAFGLPAFRSARGDVVFLKDHKTLWVDAGGVPRADLPPGFSRTAVAYGIAASVVACWSE